MLLKIQDRNKREYTNMLDADNRMLLPLHTAWNGSTICSTNMATSQSYGLDKVIRTYVNFVICHSDLHILSTVCQPDGHGLVVQVTLLTIKCRRKPCLQNNAPGTRDKVKWAYVHICHLSSFATHTCKYTSTACQSDGHMLCSTGNIPI